VLFLVHGSIFSSRGSYDLVVPGRTGYSAMDHFTGLGYDVWTMDHEGLWLLLAHIGQLGHPGRCRGPQGCAAARRAAHRQGLGLHVRRVLGRHPAGAYAMAEPKRVARLVLHAFAYTGENAPEIERRRKQVEVYKANPRRPFGLAQVQSIFDRDVAGKADAAVIKALADFELKFGDSVPSGTYLDMAINMPMVDPTRLACPVCLVRPEHDGNASEEELFRFFRTLASKDRQFVFMQGMTHGGGMVGSQRQRLWHVMHAFLTCPPAPSA
jgi:hypothetical protein